MQINYSDLIIKKKIYSDWMCGLYETPMASYFRSSILQKSRFRIEKQYPFSLFDSLFDNSWSYSISRMETFKKHIDSLRSFICLFHGQSHGKILNTLHLWRRSHLHVACTSFRKQRRHRIWHQIHSDGSPLQIIIVTTTKVY